MQVNRSYLIRSWPKIWSSTLIDIFNNTKDFKKYICLFCNKEIVFNQNDSSDNQKQIPRKERSTYEFLTSIDIYDFQYK